MAKYVKITVLRTLHMADIIDKYAPEHIEPCTSCKEGSVFVTDGQEVPKGFCIWAWSDIFKDILLVRQEAKCGSKDGKCQIASCSDGFRPVIFLLEPWDKPTP